MGQKENVLRKHLSHERATAQHRRLNYPDEDGYLSKNSYSP